MNFQQRHKRSKPNLLTVFFFLMALAAVLQPFAELSHAQYGVQENGFRHWILANNYTYLIPYNIMFGFFPVVFSLAVYKPTQLLTESQIIHKCRTAFHIAAKLWLIVLLLNAAVTFLMFPPDGAFFDYQVIELPTPGGISRELFDISPLLNVICFAFINAVAMGLLAWFITAVQLICPRFLLLSIVIPCLLLRAIRIFTDLFPHYSLFIVIQPNAHFSLGRHLTWLNMLIPFSFWILLNLGVTYCAFFLNTRKTPAV